MGVTTRFLALFTPSPLLLHHHHRHNHQHLRLSLLRLSSHNHHHHHHSHPEVTPSRPLFSSSKTPSSSTRQRQLHTQSASSYYGNVSSTKLQLSHHWPEFNTLLDNLSGYLFNGQEEGSDDLFVDDDNQLSQEFKNAAIACLAFARDRPNLIGMVSRRDLQVLVRNGTPFLFKDWEDSVRRMNMFVTSSGTSNVSGSDSANTVDLMKFLLSYASNLFKANHFYNRELVEPSARSLLLESAKLSSSTPGINYSGYAQKQFPDKLGQTPRPYGQTIEMKRGDWICTRCSFMNFARNVKCLECEEERPKRQLTGGEWECPQCNFFNYGRNMMCLRCDCKQPGQVLANGGTGSYAIQNDIGSRLAANEEKAQRWFSRVSQLESADISEIPDEDFPEIMPLRKGVNRFVVSTRKIPLERRLENAQYRRNSGNETKLEANDTSVSQRLDNILARSSAAGYSEGSNSVPFVPLPADMFSKKSDPKTKEGDSTVSDSRHINRNYSEAKENELAEKYYGQLDTVVDRNNATNMAGATQAKDYPEIVPMRKGENQFTISKKNDQSITSPRHMAMETSNNNNYVPFVPFPPGHFAKNDNQQLKGIDSPIISSGPKSNLTLPVNNMNSSANFAANQHIGSGSRTTTPPSQYTNDIRTGGGYSVGANMNSSANLVETPHQQSDNQNVRDSWKGKSLEGSAVKEPDPLDMSEEAKAERWFRRVAQIKDISELSQIPDEDFPSIMPMRKGVNRFVVSKRKTPLERRLTSQQYRRNLPVVSSDPLKNEKDSN